MDFDLTGYVTASDIREWIADNCLCAECNPKRRASDGGAD